MATTGIEGVYLQTHNYGKAAKFFRALGYEAVFESDHGSGQLRNGDGPYLFIAEVPEDQPIVTQLILHVPDAATFQADPIVEEVSPFEPTHWGTQEMIVRDPDGREWSLQAPNGG